MRLWSIHPKYLDRQGLLAVWREGLLAQKVLLQGEYKQCSSCDNGIVRKFIDVSPSGKHRWGDATCEYCKGRRKIKTSYYNHPQLDRFKNIGDWTSQLFRLGIYLHYIWEEANNRGYNFDRDKIRSNWNTTGKFGQYKLAVTIGQLEYEFVHLLDKVLNRSEDWFHKIDRIKNIESHPLFEVVPGNIESWEKVK